MKLSVITTTYNSSSFVEETIIAILDQNTKFEFEYIISDDGSTDNTLEVINNIKHNHRNGKSIRTIVNKKNQGVMKNFFGAVKQTSGDLIAFCDSDDVWGDKKKLQKQVEYMENNTNISMTYHSYKNIFSSDIDISNFDEPVDVSIKRPQTSTMVVRGILRKLINKNVVNEAAGPQNDQYLRFLLNEVGDFKHINTIKPNIRIVRADSIYSTVDKIVKKRKSLHSWQTFYKYHGKGKNKRYLAKKVKRFSSAVKWLEYEEDKNLNRLKLAIIYDLRTGIFIRKFRTYIRGILLKPLLNLKYYLQKSKNNT